MKRVIALSLTVGAACVAAYADAAYADAPPSDAPSIYVAPMGQYSP